MVILPVLPSFQAALAFILAADVVGELGVVGLAVLRAWVAVEVQGLQAGQLVAVGRGFQFPDSSERDVRRSDLLDFGA